VIKPQHPSLAAGVQHFQSERRRAFRGRSPSGVTRGALDNVGAIRCAGHYHYHSYARSHGERREET
jgi:hypothetical protein